MTVISPAPQFGLLVLETCLVLGCTAWPRSIPASAKAAPWTLTSTLPCGTFVSNSVQKAISGPNVTLPDVRSNQLYPASVKSPLKPALVEQ